MKGEKSPKINGTTADAHVRRMAKHFALSAEDHSLLGELARHSKSVLRGQVLRKTAENNEAAVLLLRGFAYRQVYTEDGGRRVIGFLLPGEMSFTQSGSTRRTNYELVAAVRSEVAIIARSRLTELEASFPQFSNFLGWGTQREIDALQNRLATICGGSAEERILQLLRNLYRRMEEIGEARDGKLRLPLTQSDLANAVGLSSVHVSKTLARLRNEGRLSTSRGDGKTEFAILDHTAG